jgi:hypothetical protein
MPSEVQFVVYGEDGPVFERVCPKCRRFAAFPKIMRWKINSDDSASDFTKVECKRCGPFDPEHIGWAGDYA